MKKAKERACDVRQEANRMRISRDNLRNKNRGKDIVNRKLRDKAIDLAESRDQWKARHNELVNQLQATQEALDEQRMLATIQQERTDQLQTEIELIFKKKPRS